MSQKANYFKIGLFVIGAVFAGVAVLIIIGTGRWFQPKVIIETYFEESVQGLDVGSRLKYRGVTIGEVTKITFTYTRYQLDLPINERVRYVLVEAELQPRLVGGRAAANDITDPASGKLEIEKGLRLRLAPQGIAGTSYLEMNYIDPPPPTLPIFWTPVHLYIPSAPSTVTAIVNAAQDILEKLHRIDFEATVTRLDKLLDVTTDRVAGLDTRKLTAQTEQTLAKLDRALAGLDTRKLNDEAVTLLAEMRKTNAVLKEQLDNPAWRKIPEDASAAMVSVRKLVSDPRLAKTIADLERITGRFDRLFGSQDADIAGTFENLRQITDNLRDLTEEAKRYPGSVIFGGPPKPLERKP